MNSASRAPDRRAVAVPSAVPEWGDVRCFLAVARELTLSRAARSLGLDAAALGRRVAQFEAAVGVRLFERTTEGLLLTAAGEGLLPAAEAMERAASEFAGDGAAADPGLVGVVRVCANAALVQHFVLASLKRVGSELPGIQIELVLDGGPGRVSRREADLTLTFGGLSAEQTVVARHLGVLGWGLYGTRRTDPERAPVIDYFEEMTALPGARWLATHLGERPRRLWCTNLTAAAVACADDWGLAALPGMVAREYPSLVRLRDDLGTTAVDLIRHRGARAPARVRAVGDALAAAFDARRAELTEP